MIESPPQPQMLLGRMESLADTTRLRLLRLLERQELGVVDLCDVLQMPQSTVSRHLKLLADQDWVHSHRQGTANLYRMILDELDPAARRLWLLAREQTEGWVTLHQDQVRLTRRLRRRQEDSQNFFAGAAREWDTMRRRLYGQQFTGEALAAMLPATWTVVDLGCGTGQTTAMIAPYVQRVIGIDASEAMLRAARKRLGQHDNVELLKGQLDNVPLDDGCCDAALLMLVLSYLSDPASTLREAARLLKPGGGVVVVDLLRHGRDDFRRQMGQQHSGFDPGELKDLLTAAGFARVTVRQLPPEESATGPALVLARGQAMTG